MSFLQFSDKTVSSSLLPAPDNRSVHHKTTTEVKSLDCKAMGFHYYGELYVDWSAMKLYMQAKSSQTVIVKHCIFHCM